MTDANRAFQPADGELELDAIVAALSVKFDVETGVREHVRRIRLDTFDRRLRAAGLSLEQHTRTSGDRFVLSGPDGSSAVDVPLTNVRWPAMADGLPAGPVRDSIAPASGIRALTVTADERRQVRILDLRNEDGKAVARVELDEPAGRAPIEPSRLIVHNLRGYDRQARRAARLVSGLGLKAVEYVESTKPSASPKIDTDRRAPATELLSKTLSAYSSAMRENLPGLLDDVDTEFLHDFRVAIRRSRATLKLGRPCLPGEFRDKWEPAFKELGDLTSPVRDLDVYELDLPTMVGWLVAADPEDLQPFAKHLRGHRTAERRKLVRGLKSTRVQRLLMDWDETLARMADSPDKDRKQLSAGQLAERGISRAYGKVLSGGTAISPDSPAEDLHRLRKRCKDLRYVLEVCAPVVAKGPRKHAVADLKGLQDVLGRFQDSEVQRRALHGFAEEMMTDGAPAAAVLAMGELIGHLDAEQERAQLEFDGEFASFARPSNQRLMRKLGGHK